MRRVGCRGTTRSGVGHFLEFGPSGQLDIAYFDQTKLSQQFGHDIACAGSFRNYKIAFLNDPKSQKRGFWPFSGLWSERKGQNSPFFEGFSSLVGLDF